MKGVGIEFIISLCLWIFTFGVGGILYCFHLKGVPILANILCALIPPLGVYCGEGSCRTEVWICLLLTCLFVFPGTVYAYWVV
jgi:uncharacterized membrane protein YqaE (UPF0057 family)